ncbi:MAG TPA: rhodanese-like domain-containing protein [Pseudogracilibacillus sp.]|nr:rhodanese-like domain-containing protein [Pseudogracilibacillus sp.]
MKEISAEELAKKIDNQENLHIIDVREDEEVAEGMIPGAKHISLGEIPHNLDKFDQSKEYIMVCRSGNRSGMAQGFLSNKGISTVNLTGGMLAWDELAKK